MPMRELLISGELSPVLRDPAPGQVIYIGKWDRIDDIEYLTHGVMLLVGWFIIDAPVGKTCVL